MIDPDLNELDMDLLNNKTLANPTNRQASANKTEMSESKSKVSPAGYSLRSNRRKIGRAHV